jgi:hypothetical protein
MQITYTSQWRWGLRLNTKIVEQRNYVYIHKWALGPESIRLIRNNVVPWALCWTQPVRCKAAMLVCRGKRVSAWNHAKSRDMQIARLATGAYTTISKLM